ncbi:MAG: alpha/beta hydrolase [Gammaproteobacteria bacterium]|nr:alpha/beta hydrolase [Gammaproteobacteria bacterium]
MANQFMGYTRDEFERQYSARSQVPDSESIVAENERASADYRQRAKASMDQSYGATGREKVDIFRPENDDAPILLFIHGGYWRSRDKSAFSFLAEPLNQAGALVAIMEYSLCPHVTMETIVRQTRGACAWLWRHGAEYGGNPGRLHVMGHSAGGHLAAMLAATDWHDFNTDLPEDLVKSVLCVSGIFELEPLLEHSVNQDLNLDATNARRLSPVLRQPTTPGPVVAAVGSAESDEFRRQSQSLVSTWKSKGAATTYLELEGFNHFSILSSLRDPTFTLTRRLKEQMGVS